jgi:hypothetical protein
MDVAVGVQRPRRSDAESDKALMSMPDLSRIRSTGMAARDAALTIAAGAVGASLSTFNNISVDPLLISRINAAAINHGIAAADLLNRLPGELEHMGTAAVDAFLQGGDALGKHWSQITGNWEDGTTNLRRSGADLSWQDRLRVSADNHLDGMIAAARTPQFWQRTLGNAVEASAYAAAIAAVDQLLIHRDALINGNQAQRKERLLEILQTSGLMAAGAFPVSIVLALALMMVPGLVVVMGPLGMLGTAGLGLRLMASAVRHPSRQEREALDALKRQLRATLYELQRDSDGNLTITVQATPVA